MKNVEYVVANNLIDAATKQAQAVIEFNYGIAAYYGGVVSALYRVAVDSDASLLGIYFDTGLERVYNDSVTLKLKSNYDRESTHKEASAAATTLLGEATAYTMRHKL